MQYKLLINANFNCFDAHNNSAFFQNAGTSEEPCNAMD